MEFVDEDNYSFVKTRYACNNCPGSLYELTPIDPKVCTTLSLVCLNKDCKIVGVDDRGRTHQVETRRMRFDGRQESH